MASKSLESPSQTPQGATLVIRSHGVSEAVLEEIHRLGIAYVDATCPFVAKIHKIVSEASAKGQTVLIAEMPPIRRWREFGPLPVLLCF